MLGPVMIDPAELNRVCGEVVRHEPARISALGLTGRAALALTDLGIPCEVEDFVYATVLQFMDTATLPGADRWVRFGTDGGTSLCVASPDGPVVSIPDSPALPVRHVNGDLVAYLQFLLRTVETRQGFVGRTDDETDARIDELEQHLRAVDASALEDPDSWWSVVIEQLRDGLL